LPGFVVGVLRFRSETSLQAGGGARLLRPCSRVSVWACLHRFVNAVAGARLLWQPRMGACAGGHRHRPV